MKYVFELFNACYPLKGHVYLNKSAALSFRFVLECITFYWTPGFKGLGYSQYF